MTSPEWDLVWRYQEAERAALDTARAHIDSAKLLYEKDRWPQACLLALTAIEMIGKALLFQRVWTSYADRERDPEKHRDALGDLGAKGHQVKAEQGAVAALIFNEEAKMRHGRSEATGLPRIDAVRYIAAADGEWMRLRNRCSYVDLDDAGLRSPLATITQEHAYLMIVGALESLAQTLAPFFGYHNREEAPCPDTSKCRLVLDELERFINVEAQQVDLERLPEIGNPERVNELRRASAFW